MDETGEKDQWSQRDWEDVYATLRRLAPRVLREFPSEIDHDEIIQQVVVKLLRISSTGQLRHIINPKAYLRMMLKRQAIDAMRSARRRPSLLEFEVVDPGADASVQHSELWEDMHDVLSRLPDDERLLFLRYATGVSIKELAEDAGMKYSAMAQRLHRMKDKLRRWIMDRQQP